ncbi:PAS domain-containing protein [Streptomyces sp. P9(2023)]|uniref:PAS domain-containing protein n=1 Tax=Streptomyces sp. P9(2023) TaxID=3064394 RepID=UPI0028F41EDD|nr:PAS domain-containing protein [Streptomyces sp. P9(2023)]MDT9689012.1 PAS domain-containing protein [Streptomyces sp. P9(2023)]
MAEREVPAGREGREGRGAVAVLDERGVVVAWSRAAERLLGVDRDRILGRPVTELLTEVDAAALTEGVTVGPLEDGDDGPGRWGLWPAGPLPGGIRSGVLEAVFTQSPVGLHVLDTELRVLRVNSAAVGMRGVPEREIVGRYFTEVYERFEPLPMEQRLRGVLATGTPDFDRRVAGYPTADPTREHIFSVSVFRLEDDAGDPLGLVASAVDVTARDRARGRLAVLHRVHARMGLSLDPVRCAQELAEAVVPVLADVAAVALTPPPLLGPDADVIPVTDEPPRCAAVWPPDHDEAPEVGTVLSPADGAGADGVVDPHRGVPYIERPATGGPTLVAPIVLRGVLLGVARFSRPHRPDPFEDDDLRLAADLAAHTAVCVDNARRYEHSHAVALALQGNLVRPGRTAGSTMETAHRYLPTGLGTGAWFDVIPLSGSRVALTVGHIAGFGPDATAAMIQLRSAAQALTALDLDPHDLLARLDDVTHRLDEEHPTAGTDERLTAQCVYAVHDPVTETCAIARAGRQTVLVGTPGGNWRTHPLEETSALGEDGPPFAAGEIPVPPGSTIVLLSGHAAPDDPALAALRAHLTPPRTLDATDLDGLPADQAAVLVARTRALGADDVAERGIEQELASVAEARHWAVRRLAEWGLEETAFAVELIVSELVTNAIRYGTSPIRLRLIRNAVDHTVTSEISDSGGAAPQLRRARAADEGGRGLFISGELSERWGVRWSEEGKTVWTETAYLS